MNQNEILHQLRLLEKVRNRLTEWEYDGFIYKRYASESQLKEYGNILLELNREIVKLEKDLPDDLIADPEFTFY